MNFFKSVFSSPTPSPPSSPSTSRPDSPNSEPDPTTGPNPWSFGSTLFQAIASKSESLLDNYYKDLQEFSSGLKKETSVIREAASRAVQDLPARLESGAAIAQESLEAVGQAIDNVTEIIGKDLNFTSSDSFLGDHADGVDRESSIGENVKPYSRIDAVIRGIQCDIKTYCEEVEGSDYGDWVKGFSVEEKRGEIDYLVEENRVVKEIYDDVVPGRVDEDTFWCRYFYRVYKAMKVEEERMRIVKRAIAQDDEEDLSWDVDDEDDGEGDNKFKSKDELKKEIQDSGKRLESLGIENKRTDLQRENEDGAGVSGTKSDGVEDEKEKFEERLKFDERVGSEGKNDSDFSVVSSQREEEDLGWDEIEDIGSGDENKLAERRSQSVSPNKADLRRRLSAAEQDEELSWDIEDDDEPV